MEAASRRARRLRHRPNRPGIVHGDAAGRAQHFSMRFSMRAPLLATVSLVLAFATNAAEAANAMAESYDGSPVVSHTELRAMRGGLAIAGMDIQLGATVDTVVNGTLAAQTVLTLKDDGTMDQQTSFMNGAVVSPVSGAQLGARTNGKIDPAAIKGAQGLTVNNVSGMTDALSVITLPHPDTV